MSANLSPATAEQERGERVDSPQRVDKGPIKDAHQQPITALKS